VPKSKRIAPAAGKALEIPKTSAAIKKMAGSALLQAKPKRKRR
jgi:hypothetical protein